jgi:hypothetical protein
MAKNDGYTYQAANEWAGNDRRVWYRAGYRWVVNHRANNTTNPAHIGCLTPFRTREEAAKFCGILAGDGYTVKMYPIR